MAELKVRSSTKKKVVSGIWKLKIVLEKLQKSLLLRRNKSSSYFRDCEERYDATTCVPKDVKEGHFAVIAEDEEESKRFVVPLSCLNNPTFLRLLEQASQEYGFDQDGALTIPCRPSDLEMLLSQQWKKEGESETTRVSWHSSNKAVVKSY
ncbi:auxin-responsive protein SAUR50-like [Abrus precatorius]|uniref:Auxin-responsive protein SAUR50-like n=1 Tax=Abrus precatorius TaxID=3816 RepID=A0A8B8KWH3_ABRPR|nr:auxin-responsive protein SAUR50-like [Abrus precatorius]